MAKYLTKRLKQGFIYAHGLRSQSMGVGKAQQQDLEPAIILYPQSGSREMDAGAQYSLGTPALLSHQPPATVQFSFGFPVTAQPDALL